MRALSIVLVVAGCDSAFGLDHVEREVTGRWVRKYEYNNEFRAPIIEVRPYAAHEMTLEARDDDGNVYPVEVDHATGEFRFVSPGADYRLVARFASGRPHELRHSASRIEMQQTSFGRPGLDLAPAGTALMGTVTPSAEGTHLMTTGLWSDTSLTGSVGAYTMPWVGPLLSAAGYDRIYVTRYQAREDANVITDIATYDLLEMQPGVANQVDVALQPLAQPYCANLRVQRTAELDRLRRLHPQLPDGGTAWGLYATPNKTLGPNVLLTLAYPGRDCESCTMHFAAPFTGFHTLYNLGAQLRRSAESLPVYLYAGTSLFGSLENSITCETYSLDAGTVAVATTVRWNGMPLDQDGLEVSAAGPTVEITWDHEGPFDDFLLDVYDPREVVSAFGIEKWRVATLEPRAVLDAKTFEPGVPYTFVVRARAGLPNVAAGDYTTVAYPFGLSYVSSAVFYVRQ